MEILSQVEIMETIGGVPDLIIVVPIIVFVGVSLFSVFKLDDAIGLAIGLIAALACLAIIVLIDAETTESVPTGRYTYKVTINESVSYNDIYDKYNVIGQEGKIWILEDK